MTQQLAPGDPAPDFALPDDSGAIVTLAGLRGRKVIVYFYPKAMTPGRTTQSLDRLKAEGFEVVAISPDTPASLAKFRVRDHLTITLLSDADKSVMTQWGTFGEKKSYGRVIQGVIRSTFVVDEAGVLTHTWYNVKATGHVAKLRRDLGLD